MGLYVVSFSGNSTALGANGHENLPVLIAIFAEAIRREAINVSEIDDDDLLDLSSPTSPSTALVHPDRTVRLASVAVQSALAFRVLGIFTHIQQVRAFYIAFLLFECCLFLYQWIPLVCV